MSIGKLKIVDQLKRSLFHSARAKGNLRGQRCETEWQRQQAKGVQRAARTTLSLLIGFEGRQMNLPPPLLE